MKKFRIEASYTVYLWDEIEAETLGDALKMTDDKVINGELKEYDPIEKDSNFCIDSIKEIKGGL